MRIVTVFLAGAVSGAAGFALWAQKAGVLLAGPLFSELLLAIGLLVGLFVACLPSLIGEVLVAVQKVNAAGAEARGELKRAVAELIDPRAPSNESSLRR